MNLVDPESFRRASTLIHVSQGAALFVLGAAEAYAADNKVKKINFLPPAAFLLGAALMMASMFYFLGGWKLDTLRYALELKGGFYVFAGFAWFFAAAGLTRFMALYMGEKGGSWQFFFLTFLCIMGLLYFVVPYRVEITARQEVFAAHAAIGASLLAAVLFKVVHFFFEKKVFQLTWAVLVLMAAGQLLIYREDPRAFEYHMVTVQSSPGQGSPSVKKNSPKPNAKPADKKRPAN